MKSISLIRASQLLPFANVLKSFGAPVDCLLRKAKLPTHLLDDPNILIPELPLWAFVEVGRHSLEVEYFGFFVAERFGLEDVGDFGTMICQSPTLFEALKRFCKSISTHSSDAQFWLQQKKTGMWFCRKGIDNINIGVWLVEQYTVITMIKLVQLYTDIDWLPTKVHLQTHDRSGLSSSKILKNVSVITGQQSTSIDMPNELLASSRNSNLTESYSKSR